MDGRRSSSSSLSKGLFTLPSVIEPLPTSSSSSAFTVPLDPQLLDDIERDAKRLATDYADMVARLTHRIRDVCFSASTRVEFTRWANIKSKHHAADVAMDEGVTKPITFCSI